MHPDTNLQTLQGSTVSEGNTVHLHASYACPATVSSISSKYLMQESQMFQPAEALALASRKPAVREEVRNGQKWPEYRWTHTHIYIYILYIYNMKKYCVVTKCDKYLASNIFEAMFNMFQTQQDWNWVLQSTCMSWVLISAWVLTHRVKLFEHVPAPFPCQGQLLELSPVACLHRAEMSCN